MNIAIGEHFDQFIREQVSSGRFQSVGEVVLEGLRMLEYRESRIRELRLRLETALDEGGAFTDEEVATFLAAVEGSTDIYIDREAKLLVLRAYFEASPDAKGGYSDEDLDELLRRGEFSCLDL